MGMSMGRIDIYDDYIEPCCVTFYDAPPFNNGKELVSWSRKDSGFTYPIEIYDDSRKGKVIDKNKLFILEDIFFKYYQFFIGDEGITPPFKMGNTDVGVAVFANRFISRGETFKMGVLHDEFISEKKLDYYESIGCLTTCQLPDEDGSREICGPIRYINHSCKANCNTYDFKKLEVRRDIHINEEITVYYFDGADGDVMKNFHCLCTCCRRTVMEEEKDEDFHL